MAMSLQANFTATESVPSGFTSAGSNPISASGGIGVAANPAIESAISRTAPNNANQAVAVTLSYTSFAPVAVFARSASPSNLTANRYLVKLLKTSGVEPDVIQIIKRYNGSDTIVGSRTLIRGKIASSDQLKMHVIDAGTVTIVEAYVNTIQIFTYTDSSNPLQGAGHVGVWMEGSSSGMAVDNAYAGDLDVFWVSPASGGGSNPAQVAGSDSSGRNGSYTQPWATIKYGGHKSRLTPNGSILMIRGGSYSDRINDAFSDILWRTGTDANVPVIYQGFPGEAAQSTDSGGATAMGVGINSNGLAGTNHVWFINLIMDGQGTAGGGMAISDMNNYIGILRCTVRNQLGNAFIFSQRHNANDNINHHHILSECEGGGSDSSGEHGVYDQVSGTIVEFCYFHDNYPNPTGTGAWGIQHNTSAAGYPNETVNTSGCIYRFNVCTRNGGGITIGGTNGCIVMGNLVYLNNNAGGISISGYQVSGVTVPDGTIIINNTIWKNNTPIGSSYGIRLVVGSTNTICKNNLLYQGQNGKTGINDESTGATLANNFNATKDMVSETNPLFVSTTLGSENFRLQDGSPCILAGENLGTASVYHHDRDGRLRASSGVNWSIGAYEKVSASVPVIVLEVGKSFDFRFGFGF